MTPTDRSLFHVTNGDVAADLIRRAGLPGDVLPWRDVLHEGPVPAGLDAPALAEVRARFIDGRGWAPYDAALTVFAARDAALERAAADSAVEIVLWFESDLYDQLQLLQILDRLDRLAATGSLAPAIAIVDVALLPESAGFVGIGQLGPDRVHALFTGRRPVTAGMRGLARSAWSAFTAADPVAIEALLRTDTSALPALGAAFRRHLEQFPAIGDGLARTERQLLLALATDAATPIDVFTAQHAAEERPFLGDTVAWSYLTDLGRGPRPLVAQPDGAPLPPPGDDFVHRSIALTDAGRAVLAGSADRVALIAFDRWLGGVHLAGPAPAWRWDAAAERLVAA